GAAAPRRGAATARRRPRARERRDRSPRTRDARPRAACGARWRGPRPRRWRHLGVAEERVLVQVGRADREPAVVDDADLRVDIHRLPGAGLEERAGDEPSGAVVRVDQQPELAARVLPAEGTRTARRREVPRGTPRAG